MPGLSASLMALSLAVTASASEATATEGLEPREPTGFALHAHGGAGLNVTHVSPGIEVRANLAGLLGLSYYLLPELGLVGQLGAQLSFGRFSNTVMSLAIGPTVRHSGVTVRLSAGPVFPSFSPPSLGGSFEILGRLFDTGFTTGVSVGYLRYQVFAFDAPRPFEYQEFRCTFLLGLGR